MDRVSKRPREHKKSCDKGHDDQEATLWRGSSSTRGSSAATLLCLLLPSFANRWCAFLGGYTQQLDEALRAVAGTLCASSIGRNVSYVRLALTADDNICDGTYLVYSLLSDAFRGQRSMRVEARPTPTLLKLLHKDDVTAHADRSQPRVEPLATADPGQPLVVGGELNGKENIVARTTCAWRRLHVTGHAPYTTCNLLVGLCARNLRSVVIDGVVSFKCGGRGRTRACRRALPNLIHLSVAHCVSLGVFDAPSLRSVTFVGQCPTRELTAGASLDSLSLAGIKFVGPTLAAATANAKQVASSRHRQQQPAVTTADTDPDDACGGPYQAKYTCDACMVVAPRLCFSCGAWFHKCRCDNKSTKCGCGNVIITAPVVPDPNFTATLAGVIANLGVDHASLKLSIAGDGFGNLKEAATNLANVRSDLLTFQLRGTFGSPAAADHGAFQACLRDARSACPGKLVKCVVDDPALMVSFAW